MRLARIAALGAAAIILSIGAVACGGDDDDGGGNGGGTTPSAQPTIPRASTPTTAATATEPAGNADLGVTAADFSFTPAALEATAGEAVTVTLTNGGNAPHTLTVYEDAAFTTVVAGADTGQIAGGGEGDFTVTFAEAKTYHFRCEIHPVAMIGTITVE